MRHLPAHWAIVGAIALVSAEGEAPRVDPPQSADLDRVLVEAISLVPDYLGEHRYFLTPDRRRDVAKSIAGLESVLGNAAASTSHRRLALRQLGLCFGLLGEDSKNRGNAETARSEFLGAVDACTRALELQPEDSWAHYARGIAFGNLGRHAAAATEFDRAMEIADEVIAACDGQSGVIADPKFDEAFDIRYRASYRRADSLMRAYDVDGASRAFDAHATRHSAPGERTLARHRLLGAMRLFLHDFDGADREFAALTESVRYSGQSDPYAERGYIALAMTRWDAAHPFLWKAIDRAPISPYLMYLWIYRWVHGVHAQKSKPREEAEDELAYLFLNGGPSAIWDRTVVSYLLAPEVPSIAARSRSGSERSAYAEKILRVVPASARGGTDAEFIQLAQEEFWRRSEDNMPPGSVYTESWYFVGVRREHLASTQQGELKTQTRLRAVEAYAKALSYPPTEFLWEFEYARERVAALAHELNLPAAPLRLPRAPYASIRLHPARSGSAIELESLDGYEPRVGDHLSWTWIEDGFERTGSIVVVPALDDRQPPR